MDRELKTYFQLYGADLREFQGYETTNYVIELDRWGPAGQSGSRAMHSKREVFPSAAQTLAHHIMRTKTQVADYERRIARCQDDIKHLEDITFKKGLLPDVMARLQEYEAAQRRP